MERTMRIMAKKAALAMALTLATVPAVAGPAVASRPAEAAIPAENGKVFFVGFEPYFESPREIFSVNPDGRGRKQVTDTEGTNSGDNDPAVSPNGKKIAFSRTVDTDTGFAVDIYTANADGTGLKKVTDGPASDDRYPTWSPDGKKIAFARYRDGASASNRSDVYLANADGTGGVKRITDRPGSEIDLAWSPDGARLLFASTASTAAFPNPGGDYEIYAMNPDGSGASRLTDNAADDSAPDWSPDGEKVAFTGDPQGAKSKSAIYTMSPDGSGRAKIVADTSTGSEYQVFSGDSDPAWSPDGTKIAFVRDIEDVDYGTYLSIYAMNADGSEVKDLSDGFRDVSPDWQPRPATP